MEEPSSFEWSYCSNCPIFFDEFLVIYDLQKLVKALWI